MKQRPEVVGPQLRRLLVFVLFLFACLAINSIYLGAVTLIEWLTREVIQNHFYQWMFLVHLVLGLLLIVPTVVYGVIHHSKAHSHRNRRAAKAGYAVLGVALLLLFSGLALTRGIPWVELKGVTARLVAYWLHVVTPFILVWLYVLHRLVGRSIHWRGGAVVLGVAVLLSSIAIVFQSQDPRQWNKTGPDSAERYFHPSLARTVDGQFIQAKDLMRDEYCQECHQDVHASWQQSMHRLSSFNNPAYAFSVNKTREFLQYRDGNVQAARFCAGCHDPVPFFSGEMDQPNFGNNNETTAHAGITCSVCHSITHINSPRGNADYTIEAPLYYPFVDSKQPFLQWVNQTLVKAKPEFHKKTFLKPLHKSPEFCGSCHKVHLPEELNGYRWLRGQNHYDSFLLSGVSGHGVQSFYYPEKAKTNCNDCHMPLQESDDFSAKQYLSEQAPSVHDHHFAAGNTAITHQLNLPNWAMQKQIESLQGVVRVDFFALREGATINGKLVRPKKLEDGSREFVVNPGKEYLLEVVVRTLTVGHLFTQGTADSNQLWLNLKAETPSQVVAESGAVVNEQGRIDPWSHFLNAYVIDKDGNRIDRRNPENIFTQLYNNQIPPGASDVIHYRFKVPEASDANIDMNVSLNYRKFDTTYLQHIEGEQFKINNLPITVMASDKARLVVSSVDAQADDNVKVVEKTDNWQRWNDYGIGLLRREQFRQAEQAFEVVEALGYGAGALNLARVYLTEGRLEEAADALTRAINNRVPAEPWSVSYFTARLNLQNGFFEEAITAFKNLVETNFQDARDRGFDFSKDYRLLNELGFALAERAKFERGSSRQMQRDGFRREAVSWYKKTLELDPENVTAHYALAQLNQQLDEPEQAELHRQLHAKYKIDDNAKDRAVQLARNKDKAADRAANKVVIYDLAIPNNN